MKYGNQLHNNKDYTDCFLTLVFDFLDNNCILWYGLASFKTKLMSLTDIITSEIFSSNSFSSIFVSLFDTLIAWYVGSFIVGIFAQLVIYLCICNINNKVSAL